MTSTLFETYQWGGHALKNRMALAPLTRGRAGSERVPNELMAEYYHQRATAGLIITEATVVSAQGNGWVNSPGIYTDEMADGWAMINDKLAPTNTPMILQMWHCGRASHSDFHGGDLPVSASAVKLDGDEIRTPEGKKPYETPRALETDEIASVVHDYKVAAQRAKDAGFAGVEVHGANGYLVNQFLDGRSNQRDDQYGGSIENRFRFFKEILEAVYDVFPSENVGVRLSPNGAFNDMGSDDFRETFLYAAEQLAAMDIGYMHIMDGLAFGFHERGEPMTLGEFRNIYKGTIIGNCGYTKEDAETRINSGDCDIAAFGRPYITNPDLPARFENDWPLADFDDPSHWYTPGAEGYTDYPTYQEA